MRNANLIFNFIERGNQGDKILCEFHKKIEIADIPPLGYTVLYPENESIAKFYVQNAEIQNKSGNLNLYGTMEIDHNDNWDYTRSVEIIQKMKELGWQVKLMFEDLQGRIRS